MCAELHCNGLVGLLITISSSALFEHVYGESQFLKLLQEQLASSQQTVEELQKQVTELQQHNRYLQLENDEQEALIQSWSRAAESRSKRPRISDAAA